MSSCSDLGKYHRSDYSSHSHSDFKHILNYNSVPNREGVTADDRFVVTFNANDMNRVFKHAKRDMVPLDNKIDQIIRDYLDWHAYAPDAKMLYMPKPWMSKVLNQLTRQQISTVAFDVSNEFKDICLLLRGDFTIHSFLDLITTWLRINRTPCRQIQYPDEFRLFIKHDMGYNYSLLIKEVFRRIVSDFFHLETGFVITEDIFALKISMAE